MLVSAFFLTALVSTQTPSRFETALAAFSSAEPDSCGSPFDDGKKESTVFDAAAQEIVVSLNGEETTLTENASRIAIDAALRRMEASGARTNAAWPPDAKFHGALVAAWPLMAVKLGFRDRAAIYAFARSESNPAWHVVSETSDAHAEFTRDVELFAVMRGPSRRARVLSRRTLSGCGGSLGLSYDLFEWSPASDALSSVLSIEAAETWGDVRSFPPIGQLHTDGAFITLPYCWFSAIDTWDNPSLCAADTFDVSGDAIRFRSRATNRPDLYPIAQAIKYARARDARAVLGYCATSAIARRLARDMPDDGFADTLTVTRLSRTRERVTLEFDPRWVFEVERRGQVWTIVRFRRG